ncbi:hypothetical protein LTR65_007629 [Meristemomyces frigidus]
MPEKDGIRLTINWPSLDSEGLKEIWESYEEHQVPEALIEPYAQENPAILSSDQAVIIRRNGADEPEAIQIFLHAMDTPMFAATHMHIRVCVAEQERLTVYDHIYEPRKVPDKMVSLLHNYERMYMPSAMIEDAIGQAEPHFAGVEVTTPLTRGAMQNLRAWQASMPWESARCISRGTISVLVTRGKALGEGTYERTFTVPREEWSSTDPDATVRMPRDAFRNLRGRNGRSYHFEFQIRPKNFDLEQYKKNMLAREEACPVDDPLSDSELEGPPSASSSSSSEASSDGTGPYDPASKLSDAFDQAHAPQIPGAYRDVRERKPASMRAGSGKADSLSTRWSCYELSSQDQDDYESLPPAKSAVGKLKLTNKAALASMLEGIKAERIVSEQDRTSVPPPNAFPAQAERSVTSIPKADIVAKPKQSDERASIDLVQKSDKHDGAGNTPTPGEQLQAEKAIIERQKKETTLQSPAPPPAKGSAAIPLQASSSAAVKQEQPRISIDLTRDEDVDAVVVKREAGATLAASKVVKRTLEMATEEEDDLEDLEDQLKEMEAREKQINIRRRLRVLKKKKTAAGEAEAQRAEG